MEPMVAGCWGALASVQQRPAVSASAIAVAKRNPRRSAHLRHLECAEITQLTASRLPRYMLMSPYVVCPTIRGAPEARGSVQNV